jgi:hypothetical protein
MIAVKSRKETEMGAKPNNLPSAVKGRMTVATTTATFAKSKGLLGLLLKNRPLVRITNTISEAEITDSMNQPVLN